MSDGQRHNEAEYPSLISDPIEALEDLLDQCLATQLLSAYDDANDPNAGGAKERKLH